MASVAARSLSKPQPGEYAIDDRVVTYACPRCGDIDTLNGHTIHPDGKVTPPWSCSRRGCGAAAWLILDGFGDA